MRAQVVATNLVVNPGFETYSSCPVWASLIYNATGWNNPVGISTSTDYINTCMISQGGVNLYNTTFGPHTGDGFARLGSILNPSVNSTYHEYLQVSLTQPLIAGIQYKISFYAGLGDESTYNANLVGAYVSDNSVTSILFPSTVSMQGTVNSTVPQFQITNIENWAYYEATFIAQGGETMLTIGNFTFNNSLQNLTQDSISSLSFLNLYYIDDVSLYQFDTCALVVQNSINNSADTVQPCLGDTVTISAYMANPNFTPSWNNNAFTAQSFTTDTSGVYICNFTYNNCNTFDTLVVDFVTPIPIDVGDTLICAGDTLTLINPDTSFDASISYSGITLYQGDTMYTDYDVNLQYVLSKGDCEFGKFFQISFLDQPELTVPNDTFPCVLLPYYATGSALYADTYLWNTGSDSLSTLITDTGLYILEVSNMCGSVADSMVVGVYQMDYNLNIGNDTLICNHQPLDVNIQGNVVQALWNDGVSSFNRSIGEGTWWVDIMDNNCVERDSITVEYPLEFEFGFSDTTLCDDDILQLNLNVNWMDSLWWSDGTTSTSLAVNQPNVYWINLYDRHCVIQDTFRLTKDYSPSISFADTTICLGDQITLNMNPDYMYDVNGVPIAPPYFIQNGNYYDVSATNYCGTSYASFQVEEVDCSCHIYIPNTFTPNGDENNQTWRPSSACIYSEYELSVYNRWGELVFRTNEPAFGWDGTYHGQLVKEGAYVYTLFYTTEDDLGGSLNGHVNVIR